MAEILGYVKPLNALATHVDKDDSLKQGLTDSMGRIQETIIINESGLYSLILSSKFPNAKKFLCYNNQMEVSHGILYRTG